MINALTQLEEWVHENRYHSVQIFRADILERLATWNVELWIGDNLFVNVVENELPLVDGDNLAGLEATILEALEKVKKKVGAPTTKPASAEKIV